MLCTYCGCKLMNPTVMSFFFSELLKMNEELTTERDQLLTTVEGLREKLNKASATQQETEAEREKAMENISQVWQTDRTPNCS